MYIRKIDKRAPRIHYVRMIRVWVQPDGYLYQLICGPSRVECLLFPFLRNIAPSAAPPYILHPDKPKGHIDYMIILAKTTHRTSIILQSDNRRIQIHLTL
jgi:hypothetical protein